MAVELSKSQIIGISLLAVILVIVIIVYALSDDDSSSESAKDCIPPNPVTTGYDISNVTGSLSKDSFSITGVRCATGYTGTEPSAIVCGTAGGEYTLSGCSVSTQPVDGGDDGGVDGRDDGRDDGGINNCDENEPDLTDSNMDAITANSCDGTAIEGTCVHTCNNEYTGGSVTCQADGTWAVVPCNQTVTEPAPETVPSRNIPTNVTFSLSDSHQSCTAHCNSHPDGPKQCFNDTDAAASVFRDPVHHRDILPSECENWIEQAAKARTYPYLFSGSTHGCYYYAGEDGISYCEDSTNRRRICKCGNQ